ncbi:helix-turn-helix transcriptional regulator [Paraburkholderia rhizosphaerae]|uniref:AraC-like DNA-binding protein n=1 Tax=Paraburkholderia rhizosphaerae TaxID=480658 RepID=A0A4R8LUM7_9BURK|nr:AraC family transcriptional regulator [Paraburkholderia rhizosphaerae]TDY51490.1 AraC-like DNA-binding protein [Paraburkholderia rhizosphaerae]
MSSFISLSGQPSMLAATGRSVGTPLPPAQPRALLRQETCWRRMPLEHADGGTPPSEGPVVLARWAIDCEGEGTAVGPQGYYVVALALRPTLLRLSTNGSVLHDGPIDRGMVQVTAPATPTEFRAHAPADFLHIYLSADYVAQCPDTALAKRMQEAHDACYPFMRDSVIRQLMHVLVEALESPDPASRSCVDAVARAIAARALGIALQPPAAAHADAGKTPALENWRLQRTIAFIDDHLDQPISLQQLAHAVGLSPTYFAARFRAAVGASPRLFVMRRRIERAKVLLASTRMSMIDVALNVGFRTQSHFTTVFGRQEGATPYQWRMRCASAEDTAAPDDPLHPAGDTLPDHADMRVHERVHDTGAAAQLQSAAAGS